MFIGVVVIDDAVRAAPPGTRDSKLLAKPAREELVPALTGWCTAWSIGEVSAQEIDRHGLTYGLGLAVARAVRQLPVAPDAYILDGPFDYVSPGLREHCGERSSTATVHTKVGADSSCSSVAAASVIAKVLRDARMRELSEVHPSYGFDVHAGYGTRAHASAIEENGPCSEHRQSWSIAALDATVRADTAFTSVDVC